MALALVSELDALVLCSRLHDQRRKPEAAKAQPTKPCLEKSMLVTRTKGIQNAKRRNTSVDDVKSLCTRGTA